MTKIAVFLCAVLLISGAQASYISDTVVAVQEKVEAAIDVAITQVQETVNSAKEKATDIGEELKAKAEQLAQKVYDQIREQLTKIDDQISEILAAAGSADVSECVALGEKLEQTALAAISNMSSCVVDKIELGSGYVEAIIQISDDIVANLTLIREEARHCSDNVDGVTSAAKAIVCANLAAAKATWATAKGVPSVTSNVAKLGYLLTTLPVTLPYCTARNGFTALLHESDRVIDDVRRCVDRHVAEQESNPTTPPAATTTPSGPTQKPTSYPEHTTYTPEQTSTRRPEQPTHQSNPNQRIN